MKKYFFLTLIVLFIGNTFADTVHLNCDFSKKSKDWKNKKEQSIDKKFFIIVMDEYGTRLSLKGYERLYDLKRGVYEFIDGDLVGYDRDKITYDYVSFWGPAESTSMMQLFILRDTLEIVNSGGNIFGKCVVKTAVEWSQDVYEYTEERTKNNVF